MEYIDIYDSEGKPLGIKATKEEAHAKGLWHRAVYVCIINHKKEVLIQKRAPGIDRYPNMWDISVVGHVSSGEDDITTTIRETGEEIGVYLLKNNLIEIGIIKGMTKREGYINNEINPVFIVKMDLDSTKIVKQKEEVSEVKMMPFEEFKNHIENDDPSFVPRPEIYKLLFDYINNNL